MANTSSIKPALLTVDDDRAVLHAVERDLRRKYAAEYKVIRAESGSSALDLLKELKLRNEPLALMLVDERMPKMSGINFLTEALKIYPKAKRVLLTAYSDTDAAINAINKAQIDHYLLKPWDPPEANLYPVLDDLLEDFQADFHPPFQGVRVLGDRWSPASHSVRDFLARNHVPYRWLDIENAERDPEIQEVRQAVDTSKLRTPVVVFSDGSSLSEPSSNDLAEKLGLKTRAKMAFYDLAIVGGGPAGLAAAVYGASEGLKTVLVEREAPGGQAGLSSRIENYLGFPSGLSGADLARRAVTQARRFGVEILSPQEAEAVRIEGNYKFLKLSDGNEFSCHALLIASGVQWRKLDIPGMDRLQGAGVYYGAAMTEAISCKDEDVYIIGGANSAGQAAMGFSDYARRVVMLVRAESLAATMSQYLIDQIVERPNIHVEYKSQIVEVHGETRLESISILCSTSSEVSTVPATSLFIFIGAEPRTGWLEGVVQRDERGFIYSGPDLSVGDKKPKGWTEERSPMLLETNVPGIFVVGDVRHGSIKRVASGVGEGSVAVQFIHQYLSKL